MLYVKELLTKILTSITQTTGTGTAQSALSGMSHASCALTKTGKHVRATIAICKTDGSATIPMSTDLIKIPAAFAPTATVEGYGLFIRPSSSGSITGKVKVAQTGDDWYISQAVTSLAYGLYAIMEWDTA